MSFMAGRDDFALIPPLQLAQAYSRNIGDFAGRIRSFLNFGSGRLFRALNITALFRFGEF